MPRSPITLLQRKMLNAWLHVIRQGEPDALGFWAIRISALSDVVGFNSNNREHLKEAARGLMSIVHEWDVLSSEDKRVKWKASVVFPEVEITATEMRFQVSSQLRETLLQPAIWAPIDQAIARRFKHAPSLPLWEFCTRFLNVGRTMSVPWRTLSNMLLGKAKTSEAWRDNYKYFNARVLKPAILEINNESDLTIRMLPSYNGRAVTTIGFSVTQRETPLPDSTNTARQPVMDAMLALGLRLTDATRLLQRYDDAAILDAVAYTVQRQKQSQQPKLKNVAAYFRRALTDQYRVAECSAKPEKPKAPVQINLQLEFETEQSREAQGYFAEVDDNQRADLIRRYNDTVTSKLLKYSDHPNKLVTVAFNNWLATELWGKPSTDDLLNFAQRKLAEVAAAA